MLEKFQVIFHRLNHFGRDPDGLNWHVITRLCVDRIVRATGDRPSAVRKRIAALRKEEGIPEHEAAKRLLEELDADVNDVVPQP